MMYPGSRKIVLTLTWAILGATVLGTAQSRATDTENLPANARVMTGVELYMLYRDRSWIWRDGAGHMQSDDRRFTAWAESDSGQLWAEGRWIVTDSGRLCLQADWHAPSVVYPNRTCFSHAVDGGTIYQRRLPDGDWYVFKHAKPLPDDEFGKLSRADVVSSQIERIRTMSNQSGPAPARFRSE